MLQTLNVFINGLRSDMHPLTTSQLEYVDALNATLITFNGNELMLQNDMGNTKIQDAKTGNVMCLREGFIPVGMKEHGGVIYITSVNNEGVGEIGTIPSPVIRYNVGLHLDSADVLYDLSSINKTDLIKLTDDVKLNPGEKFVVMLSTSDSDHIVTCRKTSTGAAYGKQYKEFSYHDADWNNVYGVYKVGLYSQTADYVFDLNKYTEYKYEYE